MHVRMGRNSSVAGRQAEWPSTWLYDTYAVSTTGISTPGNPCLFTGWDASAPEISEGSVVNKNLVNITKEWAYIGDVGSVALETTAKQRGSSGRVIGVFAAI